MDKKVFLIISLILGALFIFINISYGQSSYKESRVRYILADISLGGPLTYYKNHSNDPNAVEAVKRWDRGIRVTNINQFDRKFIIGKGTEIVYKGTTRKIKGMDVRLTKDVGYKESRVRYILADISLGGPLIYYKNHSNDPNAVEAVKRWDNGVRVTNTNRFERKFILGKGPEIVYIGTTRKINGMDGRLTTDK